jgi:hypothetical protein
VAGSCEYDDEPAGSDATELVSHCLPAYQLSRIMFSSNTSFVIPVNTNKEIAFHDGVLNAKHSFNYFV